MSAAEPLTITDAAPLIRTGRLTPSDLLEQCLVRVDQYEPHVKAWVYLDRERARLEAAQLTDEIKKGHYRGPLHGIPVGIKDIIDVFDMPTGCGSKLWANSYARRDATCVERLRQAGALVLGKTVTTPYAYLDPPPTRNPWNLDRTPGGSSSGSAAAVACGMCLAALGTQTGGSLTRPASYCGVYSLKPTHGRVSVDGVLPLAPDLDHVGVMANCVRDLAVVYQCIAGWDGRDPQCRNLIVKDALSDPIPDDPDPAMGAELVYLETTDDYFADRVTSPVRSAMDGFLHRVVADTPTNGRIGAITPVTLPAAFGRVPERHLMLMAAEAADTHNGRFDRQSGDYPPKIAELIRRGRTTSAADLAAALKERTELLQAFRPGRFRFLLTPATPNLAPNPETTGDPSFNSPWSYVGLPTVSLPVGAVDGLPVAVQIVSKPNWESDLLRVAIWCEKVAAFNRCLPPVPG